MTDVVGRGILVVEADATGVQAGMARAEAAVEKFETAAVGSAQQVGQAMAQTGAETQKAAGTIDAATKRFIASLERQALATGRSKGEYLELLAAQKGVSDQAAPYIAQIKATEAALAQKAAAATRAAQADRDAARAQQAAEAESRQFLDQLQRRSLQANRTPSAYYELLAAQRGLTAQAAPFIAQLRAAENATGNLGLSAKQTTAAMRLLPAQITDIVVGLASGQPAYLVAIQQGGQLKDSFGGVVPAAKALLSVFTPMRLALGGTAAAVGVLVAAFYQGAQEADAYNRAIANTGNLLGVTAGQLNSMAAAIGDVTGTQAAAAETLAALAATGDVAAASLERVGIATLTITRLAGRDMKDVVREFAELGREPVKASEKLNEQYRYLTLAVYDQIKALQEQGRTAEAAALAQSAFAETQINRLNDVSRNLGAIERAWMSVKDAAATAWSAMLNVGRDVSADDALAAAQAKFERMRAGKGIGGPSSEADLRAQMQVIENLKSQAASAKAVADATGQENRNQQAALAARRANQQWADAALTSQQKLNKALDEYRKNNEAIRTAGGALDPKQTAREEAAIREKFRDKSSGPRGRQYTDDAATRMLMQLRETEKSLAAQLEGEQKLGAAAKALVEFEQQIVDLKTKGTLTADQKSLLASEAAIRVQLEKNAAIETEIQLRDLIAKKLEEEAKAEAKFRERARQLEQQAVSVREGRQEQYDRQLGALGLGNSAREEVAAQAVLFREAQRMQAQLLKDTPEWMLGSDEYITESMRIKAALDQSLADHRAYYDALRAAQGNWQLGMKQGLANYLEDATNVAAQTERLFGGGLRGLEDALTQFFTKGKADWRAFGEFINAEVVRMILRAQVVGPLARSLQGNGGGMIGSLLGNIFPANASAAAGLLPGGVGSAPYAMGGVFSPSGLTPVAKGGVTAFASGDIVSQPTYFGYGGGKSGVMGEAGYEAIMPVARTAKGELGVKVAGNGGGGQQYHVHLHGFKGEAGELRRSSTQIAGSVAGAISRSRRGA